VPSKLIFEAENYGNEKDRLIRLIIAREMKRHCLGCGRHVRISPPKSHEELEALDAEQREMKTRGMKKTDGTAPPSWLQQGPLSRSSSLQILW
jgi:hypothetical protein